MELTFSVDAPPRKMWLDSAALAGLLLWALGMLDRFDLLVWCLPGVGLPLLLAVLPKKTGRIAGWAALALCLVLLYPAWNGLLLLANRLFARSQAAQAYEYVYFAVADGNAGPAALLLSLALGLFCHIGGGWAVGALGVGLMAAMAYFGVTPEPVWLLIGGMPLAWRCLAQPRAGRMLALTALAVALFLLVMALAPKPIPAVSALDDRLRDLAARSGVYYEQVPVSTRVPAPATVPPPLHQEQQPNRGVEPWQARTLFFVLAGLTLAILFVPAVIRDKEEKRRRINRAGLSDPDNAAAIRAMCLYARAWKETAPGEVPEEVRNIYLEAAFSAHPMTEEQRRKVEAYLRETAQSAWKRAGYFQKLRFRYWLAL